MEKSFVAQEGMPAVCIPLALLVIPLLFVSYQRLDFPVCVHFAPLIVF